MYYITTDTHFGHSMLVERAIRPSGYEKQIIEGLRKLSKDDVLIHLGDVAVANATTTRLWMDMLFKVCPAKVWLCKGNHDGKSCEWYLDAGFSWAGDQMILKYKGYSILFSHMPQMLEDAYYVSNEKWRAIDINIHGHFHNSDHRLHDNFYRRFNLGPRHILIALENDGYAPLSLDSIIKKYQREHDC